jgi:hypothetical protein
MQSFGQFPGTDSLRLYNIKYVTNNPATAFTNLRLHTLLRGIIDWIDTARAGTGGGGVIGVDSIAVLNDTTIRYRKNGVFKTFILPGRHWTLQGILNNGSVLTDNETITLADSLSILSGKLVVDSITIRNAPSTSDTLNFALIDEFGQIHRSTALWSDLINVVTSIKNGGDGYRIAYTADSLRSLKFAGNWGFLDTVGTPGVIRIGITPQVSWGIGIDGFTDELYADTTRSTGLPTYHYIDSVAGTTVTNAAGSGDTLLTADGTIKRINSDATITRSTNANQILLGVDTISYVSTPAKLRDTAAALRQYIESLEADFIFDNAGSGEPLTYASEDTMKVKSIQVTGGGSVSTANDSTLVINITGGGSSISGTDGSVPYFDADTLSEDNNNFFWDKTNKRLGIGMKTPEAHLHVHGATLSGRENLVIGTVADATNDKLLMYNGSSTDSRYYPTIGGVNNTVNSGWSLGFTGFVTSTNDASSSSNFGVIDYNATRTSSATDPANGTLSSVVNRKLFTWRSNSNTYMEMHANGRLNIGSTVTPPSQLSLWASNSASGNGLTINRYGGAQGATIVGRNMRGTDATPNGVVAGDTLFGIGALGYGSSQFHARSTGLIAFIADANFSNTSNPTSISLYTTDVDNVNRQLRAKITPSGQFLINKSTSAFGVDINRSVAINKDSVQRVTSTATTNQVLIDTTDGSLKRIIGPKKYVANIAQTGTDDPTATVFENSLGSIVWTREEPGMYVGTLTDAFTTGKVWAIAQGGTLLYPLAFISIIDEDSIRLIVYKDVAGVLIPNDEFDILPVEIRVYP